MKTSKRLIILFSFISVVLSGCMVIADILAEKKEPTSQPAANPTTETAQIKVEDETILDFPIELVDGSTTSLRDYQGKTVLVVFFSIHCGHCHNESSHLEAIYQEYKEQDFMILSAEVSGADSASLQDFIDEYDITFPLGADSGAQFARYMEVIGVPHNLLIDPNGNVAAVMSGFSDADSLHSSVELHLGN